MFFQSKQPAQNYTHKTEQHRQTNPSAFSRSRACTHGLQAPYENENIEIQPVKKAGLQPNRKEKK